MTTGAKCFHYHLIEIVDRSLTGTLWRADHEQTGQRALIHRLDGILLLGEATSRESLVRSSRSLLGLRHANIAPVTEVGEDGGVPLLILGEPPGAALPDWDSPQRAAGAAERVSVMLGVAKGILHAHQQGILHRDFRPGSVNVTASDVAKVRGFVPVRTKVSLKSLLKAQGLIPGSLDYLSPEHLTGLGLDLRSDIFSFGVVLYELLSGRHPFRAADDNGTANHILRNDAEPVARAYPGLPGELAGIVDRAVRKEPEDRQQSFKEIVGELTEILPALRQLRSSTVAASADNQTPAPVPAATPEISSSSGGTIAGNLSRIRAAFAEPPPKPRGAGQVRVRRLTAGLPILKTSGSERQSRPTVSSQPAKEPAAPEVTPPKATAPAADLRPATVPVVEKPRIKPAAGSPVETKQRPPAKAAAVPDITLGAEPPRERRALVPAATVLAIVLAGGGYWHFGMRTKPAGLEFAPVPETSDVVSTPAPPTEPDPTTSPPAPDPPAREPASQTRSADDNQQPAADSPHPSEPARSAPRPWTDPAPAVAAGRAPTTSIISSDPPPIAPTAAAPVVTIGNLAGQSLAVPPPPPVKPPPKIGGRVQPATLVFQRPPAYPLTAKAARIDGIVRLRAHVDERGNVQSVTYLGGPKMLAQAAIDAVKKWRYKPAKLNGQPVAVDTDVQVNFTLR